VILLLTAVALAAPSGAPYVDPESRETTSVFGRDAEGIGVGLILGVPTGLSLGYRPGGPLWFDSAVAWSFTRGSLVVHADALIELTEIRTDDFADTAFGVYLGVGPRIRIGDVPGDAFDSDFDLGVRIPLGMTIRHDDTPIEGFLEIVPGVGLFPATSFLFDAALGVRFYVPAPKGAPKPTL
jgi:hypothetical protein